ncbi:CoA transferase [Rhodococcus fascians]|nr:CoA transferase [Rhodococcus fascians]
MTMHASTLPLKGVRVIEMSDGLLDMAGRILADFGADVTKILNAPSSHSGPYPSDITRTDIGFLTTNFNKSGMSLDLSNPDDLTRLWGLLETADIFIQTSHLAADQIIDAAEAQARFPGLVVLSASDFGATGPYSGFVATDAVHLSMGSQLSRSGTWPREPALVPFDLAYQSAAAQAAWAALVAHYQKVRTGRGDQIDFSVFEAVIEIVDPPFGTAGTASAGTKKAESPTDPYSSEWGRPQAKPYPIYPCADGFVRCLVLAPAQWRAMYAWLGEPEAFSDPKYLTILSRDKDKELLEAAYIDHFRDRTKADLAAEGQARGIPISPVLSLAEVSHEEHYEQRGAFVYADIDEGTCVRIPSGFVEMDGKRLGFRHAAPRITTERSEKTWPTHSETRHRELDEGDGTNTAASYSLPLSGIRVVDFGSIVFGAEAGRLFADLGADVIKIENKAFPDKYRGTSEPGSLIAKNFALGNRGRRSFGVDTRTPEGRDLVKNLVEKSDVVVSNFKPGTLERLGLGYAELSEVNPNIVWMSSSGFGDTGAWSTWLAYGPGVRSASGLTSMWRYSDDPAGFADGTTVYPDHTAARIAGVAILSALLRRDQGGGGADIRVSQAEVVLNQLTEQFARDYLGESPVTIEGAPWGVFQCSGDDQWCVVCVRDDDDWASMCKALGNPAWTQDARFADRQSRIEYRTELDVHVREWTKTQSAMSVMITLQSAGVPAGVMNRPPELLEDPHLIARDYIALQEQPGFDRPLNTVRRPFRSHNITNPPIQKSPSMGQNTVAICSDVLGLSTDAIDRLVAEQILQPSTDQ